MSDPFWLLFGTILVPFGSMFDLILFTFWDHLVTFWRLLRSLDSGPLSSDLWGPSRAQKGAPGHFWEIWRGSRGLRNGPLVVFGPPRTTRAFLFGSLWGGLGARCTFFLSKNAFRENRPLGPQGALEEPFGPLGGPSGPSVRILGGLGPPRFAPLGVFGPPFGDLKKRTFRRRRFGCRFYIKN